MEKTRMKISRRKQKQYCGEFQKSCALFTFLRRCCIIIYSLYMFSFFVLTSCHFRKLLLVVLL